MEEVRGGGLSSPRGPPSETRDCHPTPPLISFASTLPLQGRVWVQRPVIVQHRRQLMQLLVAKTLRLDRLRGGQHVVAIVSGTAVALQHIAELFGRRQPSR